MEIWKLLTPQLLEDVLNVEVDLEEQLEVEVGEEDNPI